MAEQDNCARITRAAKKRAAAAEEDQQPVEKKKRVVLGELRNLSNVVSPPNPSFEDEPPQKQKSKTVKSKPKKEIVPKKTEDGPKEDIDDAKSDDPQMCGPYVAEIYEYLRKMEADPKRRPRHNYMEKVQNDVDPNMRGVLVDWLVGVADEDKLVPETLYLAVNYIDRFLSVKAINRQKLQLLGVSSMHIASKYEEIGRPNVEDFYYRTDNTYTRKEFVTMESDILNALKFEVGSPTTKTFLRRFTRIAQEDCRTQNLQLEFLGYYLAELSLLDYYCLQFLPSKVAASVIFLARYIIRPKIHPWNSALQRCTGYRAAELESCVIHIHDLYLSRRGEGLHAVREKYRQHEFKCVASLPSPPDTPSSLFEVNQD